MVTLTEALCYHVFAHSGGERGPVTFPAFKAGDSALSEPSGEFDSHTLPPNLPCVYAGSSTVGKLV
jgi:hypothetical protein